MTHPDYSGIPIPMICVCKNIQERNIVLSELRKMNVPTSHRFGKKRVMKWDYSPFGEGMVYQSNLGLKGFDVMSIDQFLAPFREVWEKHQQKEYNVHSSDDTGIKIIDRNSLIFPSDEDISEELLKLMDATLQGGDIKKWENRGTYIAKWMRDRIKELNQ